MFEVRCTRRNMLIINKLEKVIILTYQFKCRTSYIKYRTFSKKGPLSINTFTGGFSRLKPLFQAIIFKKEGDRRPLCVSSTHGFADQTCRIFNA
jgi:hypothetical protein